MKYSSYKLLSNLIQIQNDLLLLYELSLTAKLVLVFLFCFSLFNLLQTEETHLKKFVIKNKTAFYFRSL